MAGVYLYNATTSNETYIQANTGRICGGYHYKIDLGNLTLEYNYQRIIYQDNSSSPDKISANFSIIMFKTDCENGKIYYLLSGPGGINLQGADIAKDPYDFGIVLPEELLEGFTNTTRTETGYGSWLSSNQIIETNLTSDTTNLPCNITVKQIIRYDKNTGILLENIVEYKSIDNDSICPTEVVNHYKLTGVGLQSGNASISYKSITTYSIIMTYMSGIMIMAGLLGLLYSLGLYIGKLV